MEQLNLQEGPVLMPVKEAHVKLNVSREWFYRMIKEGRIPHYKLGAKILVDMQEVLESMRRGTSNEKISG